MIGLRIKISYTVKAEKVLYQNIIAMTHFSFHDVQTGLFLRLKSRCTSGETFLACPKLKFMGLKVVIYVHNVIKNGFPVSPKQ